MKGFALELALKQRRKTTRQWAISRLEGKSWEVPLCWESPVLRLWCSWNRKETYLIFVVVVIVHSVVLFVAPFNYKMFSLYRRIGLFPQIVPQTAGLRRGGLRLKTFVSGTGTGYRWFSKASTMSFEEVKRLVEHEALEVISKTWNQLNSGNKSSGNWGIFVVGNFNLNFVWFCSFCGHCFTEAVVYVM